MASVRAEIDIDARPDDVWDALRDFGAVGRRLVPGFVVDCRVEGDSRVVTFFSGAVARERLVGVDGEARRLAYAIVDGSLTFAHHSASAQVIPNTDGGSRFVWITDLLPDELAPVVHEYMEHGIGVIKQTVEAATPRLAPSATPPA
jgi:Polyketide cyclase / dehydrase and lipid transport